MDIYHLKPRLPVGYISKKKGDKVLILDPYTPEWIVVSENGAAILKFCNGKRTVEEISNLFVKFWRKSSKQEIIDFLEKILTTTSFFSSQRAQNPTHIPHGLHIVQISLTKRCNLKCIYCYATERSEAETTLSREEHFNLIRDINNISKNAEIVITGGEPLLLPYSIELAEYAKSLGHQPQLLSNGTLITRKNAGRIAKAFSLIKISIDGSTPAINDFHRGAGTFIKSFEAYELLAAQEATVRVSMTVTRKNINDIACMNKKFGSSLNFAPLFRAGRAKKNRGLYITGKEYYKALASVDGLNPLSYLYSTLAASKKKRIMKCAIGDGEISISESGDVYPCQLLHLPQFHAGNIRKQSLKSIYDNSDVLSSFRKLTVLQIEGCKECEIRFICGGGCRARTFYEKNRINVSGDFCEYEKLAFINGLFELYELP